MSGGAQGIEIPEGYNAFRDPATGHVEFAQPDSELEAYLVKDLKWPLLKGGEVVPVTDAAAALAEAEGVDLSDVEPSGADGGIVKADVEEAEANGAGDGDDESAPDDESDQAAEPDTEGFYDRDTLAEAKVLEVSLDECERDDDGDVTIEEVRRAFFKRVTKRADLDAAAGKFGITEPEKLDNIAAVKAAIVDYLEKLDTDEVLGAGDGDDE